MVSFEMPPSNICIHMISLVLKQISSGNITSQFLAVIWWLSLRNIAVHHTNVAVTTESLPRKYDTVFWQENCHMVLLQWRWGIHSFPYLVLLCFVCETTLFSCLNEVWYSIEQCYYQESNDLFQQEDLLIIIFDVTGSWFMWRTFKYPKWKGMSCVG